MISFKRVGAEWFHVSIFKMLIKIILCWSKADDGQTGLRLPLEVATWPTLVYREKKHSNFIFSQDWENLVLRLGHSPQSSSPDHGSSPPFPGHAIPAQLDPQLVQAALLPSRI